MKVFRGLLLLAKKDKLAIVMARLFHRRNLGILVQAASS